MFRSCQAYADMTWKRCVAEYLPQNNVRTQWSKQEANFEVSDSALLVDINVERSHYKMARIQGIYPAKDGVVRSVFIKTHDGTFKRSFCKVGAIFNERFPAENGNGIVGASNKD